jgi:predicted Zn-dependent protease
LADLYLQQGLKAEASAVLSEVLKKEPENSEAITKFAAVSDGMAEEVAAASADAEINERTVAALKAFASAAEREAIHQRATERGVFL